VTAAQALTDTYTRHIFTGLLVYGDAVFGVVYSALIGFAGAVFASLGLGMLVLIRNRIVALAVPFGLFLVETVGAAVLGVPQFGLLYGLFPFGLSASPTWQALAPVACITAALVVIWAYAFSRARTLPNLA
jgi:hypothetical protein